MSTETRTILRDGVLIEERREERVLGSLESYIAAYEASNKKKVEYEGIARHTNLLHFVDKIDAKKFPGTKEILFALYSFIPTAPRNFFVSRFKRNTLDVFIVPMIYYPVVGYYKKKGIASGANVVNYLTDIYGSCLKNNFSHLRSSMVEKIKEKIKNDYAESLCLTEPHNNEDSVKLNAFIRIGEFNRIKPSFANAYCAIEIDHNSGIININCFWISPKGVPVVYSLPNLYVNGNLCAGGTLNRIYGEFYHAEGNPEQVAANAFAAFMSSPSQPHLVAAPLYHSMLINARCTFINTKGEQSYITNLETLGSEKGIVINYMDFDAQGKVCMDSYIDFNPDITRNARLNNKYYDLFQLEKNINLSRFGYTPLSNSNLIPIIKELHKAKLIKELQG